LATDLPEEHRQQIARDPNRARTRVAPDQLPSLLRQHIDVTHYVVNRLRELLRIFPSADHARLRLDIRPCPIRVSMVQAGSYLATGDIAHFIFYAGTNALSDTDAAATVMSSLRTQYGI
jgi:hypothetical protein